MKNTYLVLSIIGFVLPNVLVAMESVETGNILLYAKPMETIQGMFANRISTIFMIDLLFAVVVFFIWSYREHKMYNVKNVKLVWALTMLFGLAGAFPLFLYFREKAMGENKSNKF